MAWTVASALDQKAWAKETTFEAERKTFFKKFHGTLIKTYKDLVKNPGDTIYIPMVQRIKGAGLGAGSGVSTGLATTDSIGADSLVTGTFGNETSRIMGYDGSSSYAAYDNLVYRYDEIKLAQKRNAIRSPGTFFHQQSGFNFREHAKHVLSNWKAEITDHIHFQHIAGMTSFAWPEAASAPSTSATYSANRRLYGGNATSEATIGTDDFFTTEEIDRMRTLAKLAEPRIMPYRATDGKEYFVMVIHPYQAHTLRQDSNWKSAHYYADIRGEDNAIFSGALGIWNGVIIHEHEFVPTFTQTGGAGLTLARALFMGMEAGAWAECKEATWDEDNTSSDADFGDKPAICYGFTGGFCKLVFNSIDWGCAVIDTYAPVPAGSSH